MDKKIAFLIITLFVCLSGATIFFCLKKTNYQNPEVAPTISPTTETSSPTTTPSPTTESTEKENSVDKIIDEAISEMDQDVTNINPEEDFKSFDNSDVGL